LVRQLEALHPAIDALLHFPAADSLDLREKEQQLDDVHLLVEPALFRQISDAIAEVGDAVSRPVDRAGVGIEDAGDHPDRRRLPRAVAPEETRDRAAVDGEGDAVDGTNFVERLDDVANGEDRKST